MANNQVAVLRQVKGMLASEGIKKRFNDILGKKAPQFMGSLVNVVSASQKLGECDPNSIMAAAFVAASFDLPIDNNLGFSAIVPYNGLAQFQMMYKGFIQLAIRTGEYETMNCSEVYSDELLYYNPITGECKFVVDFSACKQRLEGKPENIIGYYAWFRLRSGFVKELYMSREEINNHAKKYSKSYQYDLRSGKKSSRWSVDFDVMAKKTVIKLLLSKWGILSIDMQRAIQDDQKVYNADGTANYDDNRPDVVPATDPFQQPQITDGQPQAPAGDIPEPPAEFDMENDFQ